MAVATPFGLLNVTSDSADTSVDLAIWDERVCFISPLEGLSRSHLRY